MSQPERRSNVQQLHKEWDQLHERLRVHEGLLSSAIALYARGEGPRPDAMMAEVEQMRAECAQRFNAMMDAVRTVG